MNTLPSEVTMYINKFIGSPTAALMKESFLTRRRRYSTRYLLKYEQYLESVRDDRRRNYEVEYWSVKYHRCCINDIHRELLYGIVIPDYD